MSSSADRPVLVTGAGGQVGTALRSAALAGRFLDRSELDLAQPETFGAILSEVRPRAVINAAAYTDVDGAEDDEAAATTINGTAVGELAAEAGRLDIPFVTYSTDYVFGGDSERTAYREADPTLPINAYGRSKVVGEELALDANPKTLIIRTSWVVSETHDNFVSTVLRLTDDPASPMRVVADQYGRPTAATDLAVSTMVYLNAGVTGIVHCASGPPMSWFDLAASVAKRAGRDGVVEPCTTDEFPRPAPRPRSAILESGRTDLPVLEHREPWGAVLGRIVERQLVRLSR